MAKRVVFSGAREVSLENFDAPRPGPSEVVVRSVYSLLSPGTERIVYNRKFEAGTGWASWVKYPFYPGYALVGEVALCGSEVRGLSVGDRVALRAGHACTHVVAESRCVPIPDDTSFDDAVWFALAKITFVGARAACYALGDSVLVIGAGPIGQLSARWANAAGAQYLVVADPFAPRLPLATRGGASSVIDSPVGDAIERVRAACGGELPRVVLDSTGNAAVFVDALRCCKKFGRVVLLGDTGTPSQQRLTHDVIQKGLTIVGAHDGHETTEWTLRTISSLFFDLVQSKRFDLEG
ncbi:MAG TPA: zinc-binding alcohol dehydrogenase, partial [Polyangiaceae bacterium]|nr:zinc-binding alcohol dehydrogenase [Polyangiaceae bacterium]